MFIQTESTPREVGSFNYMNWEQIKEIANESFVHIGNHSHTHEYLVEEEISVIKNDIVKSIEIFKQVGNPKDVVKKFKLD